MPSAREMRVRIRSVKNISQVTRALEAVSASKVRKAVAAVTATRPYATKAWQVLTHIAKQPGRATLHPLLARRPDVRNVLVVVVSGDRGLAGAYNTNVIRFVNQHAAHFKIVRHNQVLEADFLTQHLVQPPAGERGRSLVFGYIGIRGMGHHHERKVPVQHAVGQQVFFP